MAEPIRYVCVEGHPSFTIEDIELAPAGDVRHDPAWDLVQALADYQANLGDASENIPKDGWLRVVDGPEEVVFLAEISEKGALYAVVNVVLASGGFLTQDGWAVDSFGPCTPRPDVPEDVSVADWWVNTSGQPIDPDAERIPALVHESACASGQSAEGRILPPAIIYGPTR